MASPVRRLKRLYRRMAVYGFILLSGLLLQTLPLLPYRALWCAILPLCAAALPHPVSPVMAVTAGLLWDLTGDTFPGFHALPLMLLCIGIAAVPDRHRSLCPWLAVAGSLLMAVPDAFRTVKSGAMTYLLLHTTLPLIGLTLLCLPLAYGAVVLAQKFA